MDMSFENKAFQNSTEIKLVADGFEKNIQVNIPSPLH